MIFNLGLNEIESGIKGENNGLDIGLPRLTEYIPGLQPSNIQCFIFRDIIPISIYWFWHSKVTP